MPKKKAIISSILAIISGSLGLVGSLGLCCTITGALILSTLGLASISSYFTYYNKWFYLAAIIFSALAIYYYIKYKRHKKCKK